MALLVGVSDAEAEDCVGAFTPDRPNITNGHWTVPSGCAMVEGGVAVDRDLDRGTQISAPSLFRFGLLDTLELRASTRLVVVDVPDEGPAEGLAPTAGLEVKLTGLEAHDGMPGVGLLAGFGTSFNDDFGARLSPSTSLLFDWEMAEGLWLAVNPTIGVNDMGDRDARAFNLSYGAAVSYSLTDELGAFVNAWGGGDPGDAFDQWLGWGFNVLPADGWQIDFSIDGELTRDHPILVQAGFSTIF